MLLQLPNIKLIITYDGSSFLGFQKTEERLGIEDFLSRALKQVLNKEVKIQGASRTDKGVHAHFQVVNFFLPTPFPLLNLLTALNANLPKQIRITSIENVEPDFHPTLSAKSKTYRYLIENTPIHSPFKTTTTWHVHEPLDLYSMKEGAKHLIGTHDFSAFATKGHNKETVRTVYSIDIVKDQEILSFTVKGKSFLYHMVRTIVGTLVYIGKGKLNPIDCKKILSTLDRRVAGPCAPAHGLSLYHIDY